jgi:hypothetical protein
MTEVSDFTGVQAVTATIRQILQQRMEEPVPITTAPPDVEVPNVDRPLANLFLYMVEESATLKNQDLPGMAGPMSLGQPPLSLNLHYLVTASGPDPNDDRGGHRVLGDVMLTLHEHPIVAKDDPLLDPVLQNEVELLKITMEPLDVEGLSKVWTATTAPLRLSVGYKVTVVQLESTQPRSVAKPVKELPAAGPRVYAVSLNRPVIANLGVMRRLPDLTVEQQSVPYARVGEQLVVEGSGFFAGTRPILGEVDASASVDPTSTSSRMLVTVEQESLLAGVHRLQLVRDVDVGEPPDERSFPFMRSNVAAFVLIPTVTDVTPASGPPGTDLVVQGVRLFRGDAPSMVLVGDRAFPVGPDGTDTQVEVTVTGLPSGVYPVSVRVNGAESIDAFDFEVI